LSASRPAVVGDRAVDIRALEYRAALCCLVLAPGAAAKPHAHVEFETAIHMLEGTIELWHGADLEQRLVLRAGDFVFIAPGVMHQPRNASLTSRVRAVVARNTPVEQESVVLRDEARLVAI
jgi:uncharacterized RmlC-like cupin family protein